MKRLLIVIFLLGFISVSYAEEDEWAVIDSLYQLQETLIGEDRVETLINLSEAYRLVSYDKSIKTGQDALLYAKNNSLEKTIGKVYKSMGVTAYQGHDYQLALELYDKATEAFDQIEDHSAKATVLNNIGLVYKQLGNNEKALEYYQQAYTIQFEMKDLQAYATTNINIAGYYFQLGEFDKAYDAYYQAQLIFHEIQDSLRYAQVTNNLANVYWQWDQNEKALQLLDEAGEIYKAYDLSMDISRVLYTQGLIFAYDFGDYEQALDKFNQSLDYRTKSGNTQGIANVMINIANVWMEQERYEEAFSFFERGLHMHEAIGNADGILMAYYYMGIANQKLRRFSESEKWLKKCEAKSEELNSRLYEELITEARLINAAGLGDFESFVFYFDRYSVAKDSLTEGYLEIQMRDAQNRNQITALESQLENISEANRQYKEKLKIFQNIFYTVLGFLGFAIVYVLVKYIVVQFKTRATSKRLP